MFWISCYLCFGLLYAALEFEEIDAECAVEHPEFPKAARQALVFAAMVLFWPTRYVPFGVGR